MLKIDEKILISDISSHCKIEDFYNKEDIIMFDIETTGLSPQTSMIYIIGINYWKDGAWWITQYFNDDGQSEAKIIEEFLLALSKYKYLIEFNGDHFDIPFVKKRAASLQKTDHLDFDISAFDNIQAVDLYRIIRPFRNILGLPNMKQKTIERYLGINRDDQMNGGELIEVYYHYLRKKDEHSKRLVLLHNRDDMEGMYLISSILSIGGLADGKFCFDSISMEEENGGLYLLIALKLKSSLLSPIIHSEESILLKADKDSVILRLPVFYGTLYYYYGQTKEGYEEKTGYFIPAGTTNCIIPYKENYRSKKIYTEINDSFLSDSDAISKYAQSVIQLILH